MIAGPWRCIRPCVPDNDANDIPYTPPKSLSMQGHKALCSLHSEAGYWGILYPNTAKDSIFFLVIVAKKNVVEPGWSTGRQEATVIFAGPAAATQVPKAWQLQEESFRSSRVKVLIWILVCIWGCGSAEKVGCILRDLLAWLDREVFVPSFNARVPDCRTLPEPSNSRPCFSFPHDPPVAHGSSSCGA